MRILGILIFLTGTMFLSGCNLSGKKEAGEENTLTHGNLVVREFGSCDTTKNQGSSVSVSLWELSDSSKVSEVINGILTQKSIERINSYADSASIAANPGATKSVKDAFAVFQKNYTDFKKDFPDAPGCWQVELSGDTVMVTPEWLFYQLDHYAFTGGAHPNSFRSYHVFDGKTGKEKQMKSFIADSVALLKLVEKNFRKQEKLAADANLEEAGYFLLNHQFFIPANYIFTREGILFYYNPYEIAAYARGAIQFTIPYSELTGIVKKEEIL
ncbi:DUF3298 and DUF4163 domain-containing protein [Dyadobacter pollutisoli]|jgi:hypothetical protein|uniref:DUF3298 domain-containing protein n=1 Tax=Dyadobacter pollutisoli TaxID=2910158 RepID=A0A9E8NC83_9BACT|nr:DUF3298 and DUF4163 domain-containing protein [Dyadobacter pollutisoli]WAC12336.1 DUF3298 domain-containing protein [Dyadobacter pollutisoli]